VPERKRAVLSAVRRFNELRSPEATAELVHLEGDLVVVKISGPFCFTCGLYDYFDDLAWEMQDRLEESVEIEAVERVGPESYLALYRIGASGRGRQESQAAPLRNE